MNPDRRAIEAPGAGPSVVVPVRSRWVRSETTFGPVGRVVATGLILAPMIFMLIFSLPFLIAGVLLTPVAYLALKHVWRPVQVDSVRLPTALPAGATSTPSIMDREAPQRW
jgi:hypothetical protein